MIATVWWSHIYHILASTASITAFKPFLTSPSSSAPKFDAEWSLIHLCICSRYGEKRATRFASLTPSEVLGENWSKTFFRLRRPNSACAFFMKFCVECNSPHLSIRPESRERAVQSAFFGIFSPSASTLYGSIAPLPGPPTPDLRLPSSSASKTTLGSILSTSLTATSVEKLISQVSAFVASDIYENLLPRPEATPAPAAPQRPPQHPHSRSKKSLRPKVPYFPGVLPPENANRCSFSRRIQ